MHASAKRTIEHPLRKKFWERLILSVSTGFVAPVSLLKEIEDRTNAPAARD
jgi:hypothetical protein